MVVPYSSPDWLHALKSLLVRYYVFVLRIMYLLIKKFNTNVEFVRIDLQKNSIKKYYLDIPYNVKCSYKARKLLFAITLKADHIFYHF
jgi:hypothetical protein